MKKEAIRCQGLALYFKLVGRRVTCSRTGARIGGHSGLAELSGATGVGSSLGVGAPPRFDQAPRSVLGKLLFQCQQKNNYLDLNCEACLRVVGFEATCRHSGSNSRMMGYSEVMQ